MPVSILHSDLQRLPCLLHTSEPPCRWTSAVPRPAGLRTHLRYSVQAYYSLVGCKVVCNRRNSSLQATAQAQQSTLEEVAVQIRTNREVPYGDTVRVVGGASGLGDWQIADAPEMTWGEGHEWVLGVTLAPGSYEFKCVVVHGDGSAGQWEDGPNRVLEVSTSGSNVLEFVCPWGETGNTIANSQQAGQTLEQRSEEAQTEQHASGNGAEDLQPSGLFEGDDENKGALAQPSSSGTFEEEQNKDTGTSNSIEAGAQENAALLDNDVEASDSQAVNGAAKQTDTGESKAADKQPPAPKPSQEESKPSAPAAIPSSDTSYSGQAAAPSSSASLPTPEPATSSQGAAELSQPGGTIPTWALALVGSVAVPITLWSIYTLKTTGCGLPPGPSGALGAAEGVSYLGVAGIGIWALIAALSPSTPSPSGLQKAVVGSVYGTIVAGLIVLGLQVQEYGYIPSALPDSKCHGEASSSQGGGIANDLAVAPTVQGPSSTVEQTVSGLASAASNAGASLADGLSSVAGGVTDSAGGILSQFKGFMSPQQEREEELGSGALDGLSSADLTAVVDELGQAANRIKELFLNALARGNPAWLPPVSHRTAGVGGFPLAVMRFPHMSLADAGVAEATDARCESQEQRPAQQQQHTSLPRWLSTGDMSFMAAATNAVTTANNVNNHLNTLALELQSSVDNVQQVIDDAEVVARTDRRLDTTELTNTMEELESALEVAQAKAARLDLHQLVMQLHEAAGRLRQSANGSAALVDPIAKRLDAAAGDLLQAAEAADPEQIKATRLRVASLLPSQKAKLLGTDQATPTSDEGLAGSGSATPQTALADPSSVKAEVIPAVQEADSIAGRLQQVVNRIRRTEPALSDVSRDKIVPPDNDSVQSNGQHTDGKAQ